MLNFEKSTLINAPVERVWEFHERPDILSLLTPPWQPVKVLRREGGLGVGAITEFEIQLGFIPIKWLAHHTDCVPYQYFVDRQVEGPCQSWVHRHEFTPEDNQTRLTDTIRLELLGGEIAEWVLGSFVIDRLEDMFTYRHQVTQRYCQENY